MTKNNQTTKNKQVKAKLRYLRTSPRKVRLVADIIRGLPVQEAEAQLMLSPRRASNDLLKLLKSAVSNAENIDDVKSKNLYIKEIRVDQGPVLKRWMPRARGAISEIQKKMSHITIVLEEKEKENKERFVIPKPVKDKKEKKEGKKEKETKEEKPEKETHPEPKQHTETEKPKERKSPFRNIFRRKSM